MKIFNSEHLSSASFLLNSVLLLREYYHNMVSMNCYSCCYLVVMIVTATPTANSIAVMAEFGGQDKDALASCIFTQYLFAPVLLAASITIFVNMVQDY